MKNYFIPKNILEKIGADYDDDFDRSRLRGYENRNDFVTGAISQENPTKTVFCRMCNDTSFLVGWGDRCTVLKCKNCGYELVDEEG